MWNDEFNASRLSGGRPALPATTNWSYETGNNGWGNNELQYYTNRPENVKVEIVKATGIQGLLNTTQEVKK